MIETPEERSKRLRITVIVGHRKRKKLCIKCGKDIHKDDCIENYDKVDTRTFVTEIIKEIDIQKKIDAIVCYRKKKLLCINFRYYKKL